MTTPESSLAGKSLNALRQIVDKTCAGCGEPYRGIIKSKFCSSYCRGKTHYTRKKLKKRLNKDSKEYALREGALAEATHWATEAFNKCAVDREPGTDCLLPTGSAFRADGILSRP